MAKHQVTCIRKPDRFSPHEHITHIGNTAEKWMITREAAIDSINSKTESFYVVDPRNRKVSDVHVVQPLAGFLGRPTTVKPYLRTRADGDWNDNLLSLPQC